MFSFFRNTQQWSVYPLVSCFFGVWLFVVCQNCVANANVVMDQGEHSDINSHCDAPATNNNDEHACCQESLLCDGIITLADASVPLPLINETSSIDLPVFAYNFPDRFYVSHTTSVCPPYQDPESATLLPIERFCVQLK
jgi:hypothetical protein